MRTRLTTLLSLVVLAACGSGPERFVEPAGSGERAGVRAVAARDVDVVVERSPARVVAERLADAVFCAALEDPAPTARLRELTRLAPHRVAGTNAHDAAVRWAEDALVAIGLDDVHREPVLVSCWDRGPAERATLRVSGVDRPLPVIAMTGSAPSPAGGTKGVVVRVTNLEELRDAAARAAGNIVFFDVMMPRGARDAHAAYAQVRDLLESGASYAAAVGAAGVIVRSPSIRHDDVVRIVPVRYLDPNTRIPAVTISPRMADALHVACLADPNTTLTMHLACSRRPEIKLANNVVGELRGSTRPEEVVLLAARLDGDAVGEGAHANAAGVAHCIAAMRLLLQAKIQPERTIRVVLFVDGIEPGIGMRSYAADNSDELALHVVAIGSHTGGFYPIGFEFSQPDASSVVGTQDVREFLEVLSDLGSARLTVSNPNERLARLIDYGVPVMGLRTASSTYYDVCHTLRDTFDSVTSQDFGTGSAMMAFAAAAFSAPTIYK